MDNKGFTLQEPLRNTECLPAWPTQSRASAAFTYWLACWLRVDCRVTCIAFGDPTYKWAQGMPVALEREMERFMVDPRGEMVSVFLEPSSTAVTEIKREPTG